VEWAKERYDVKIELSETDFRYLQLTEAKDKFRAIVNAFDGLKLSGNINVVYIIFDIIRAGVSSHRCFYFNLKHLNGQQSYQIHS